MGDIIRKVAVCGLTEGGKTIQCADAAALVDPGSTMTVISSDLARRVGGRMLPKKFHATIEGRKVPLKLTALTLKAQGCKIDALTVAVDDTLVSRAGDKVEMILGHDYLQRKHAGLRYGETTDDHELACEIQPLRTRNGNGKGNGSGRGRRGL